jgi:hypothetical protein
MRTVIAADRNRTIDVVVLDGSAAIDEFTELRWITIEGPQHYPFRQSRLIAISRVARLQSTRAVGDQQTRVTHCDRDLHRLPEGLSDGSQPPSAGDKK